MATKAMSYFRKHQKVILACVTIGTMLVFIVGDAVQTIARGGSQSSGVVGWFKNLFGGSKEDTLFRVAGTNYDETSIKDMQMKRALAQDIKKAVENEGASRFYVDLGFDPKDMQDQSKYQQLQQKLTEMREKDPAIREAETTRGSALLNQVTPSISVFGASEPNDSLAEYLHMKAKANSLGITVTNAMIRDDLLKLGMGKLTIDEIAKLVRESARARGQLDMAKLDSVLSVLADEVRVGIAKQITGDDFSQFIADYYSRQQQPRSSSSQVTLADLWKEYVQVKASLNVAILPLKVEDYLSRVAEPTETEKLAYFDKYKREYPNPVKDTPGFKIPPLYRIGLILADLKTGAPADKYYRAQVEGYDRIAPLNALAELARAYEVKKDTYRSFQPFVEFATTKALNGPWVRVYSWNSQYNQAQLANVLGRFALAGSQVGTFNPGNVFALSLTGETVAPRQNDALNIAQTIANATSLTGLLQPVLNVRTGMQENYIPFNVVAPALVEQRIETKCRIYLANDLDEISRNLTSYAKKYSEWRSKVIRKVATSAIPPLYNDETKQTLQDFLTKFANVRGLTYKETPDLRSRNDLLTEPGERTLNTFIKPLYTALAERQSQRAFEDRLRNIIVKDELGGDKPKLFEATNSDAEDRSRRNKETVLHWIAEMTEPRVPTFKEAQATVTKAWKIEKARTDVEQEAEKIVKEVKAGPDNYRKLYDMKGIVINQTIARYSEPEIKSMADTPMYVTAVLPKVLDNEPADLVDQCFDKLKKAGDAIVVADKSKTTFYVIYLDKRQEPRTNNPLDLEAFHNEVIRPSMLKQLTINGLPFRNFVAGTKKNNDIKNWVEYLKGATGMNTELIKKMNDRSSQQ